MRGPSRWPTLAAPDEAEAERERFVAAAARRVQESRMLFNNTCTDILAVGRADDAGRTGLSPAATTRRRSGTCASAVEMDDTLPYDEPWGWMQPTRHALGRAAAGAGASTRRPRRSIAPIWGWMPDAQPRLPAPGQRLEPARAARVSAPPGGNRRGRAGQAAARQGAGPRRGDDQGVVLLPAEGGGLRLRTLRRRVLPEIDPAGRLTGSAGLSRH